MKGHEGVASVYTGLGEGCKIPVISNVEFGVRDTVEYSILGAAPKSPWRLMRRHGEAEKMLKDSVQPVQSPLRVDNSDAF